METDYYLVISRNTGQMMLVEKVLRDNGIEIELVPAPPRPGLVCTRAVKIKDADLLAVKDIFNNKKIVVSEILEEKKLKLQGLIDKKLLAR
ncbi:MAG: DUF3343 domain-containing protein [Bacillota bacterium]